MVLLLTVVGAASANTCHVYRVTVQGTVTNVFGQQRVVIDQFAFWRDAGFRNNPVEFGLFVTHDLNANPRVGDIVLMTTSAFAANAGVASQQYDLASVRVTPEGPVVFRLDAGASFILPPTNVLVGPGVAGAPGGLGGLEFLPGAGGALGRQLGGAAVLQATYVYPRSGGGSFALPDGMTIVGEFTVNASGVDNAGFEAAYQGSFRGVLVESRPC